MSAKMEVAPGTVSKILWHFTGGPPWNETTGRQGTSPKPARIAFNNLRLILQSKELRLGAYREVVRVTLPEKRIYNKESRKFEIKKHFIETIESSPVCCLSDIPVAHLAYHAYRYGKFAIGFHRDAATRFGFNPVFYSLNTTGVLRSIYSGLMELSSIDAWSIASAASDIESALDDLDDDNEVDVSSELWDIESAADDIESSVNTAKESLEEFVAFVKSFTADEFGSIYCEREWRSLQPFSFNLEDIAMIVIPKKVGKNVYFDDFVNNYVKELNLPRSIPIVPWEDLVEH